MGDGVCISTGEGGSDVAVGFWWRAEKLGMGKGVAWGYQVEEMVVMMMVVEMG